MSSPDHSKPQEKAAEPEERQKADASAEAAESKEQPAEQPSGPPTQEEVPEPVDAIVGGAIEEEVGVEEEELQEEEEIDSGSTSGGWTDSGVIVISADGEVTLTSGAAAGDDDPSEDEDESEYGGEISVEGSPAVEEDAGTSSDSGEIPRIVPPSFPIGTTQSEILSQPILQFVRPTLPVDVELNQADSDIELPIAGKMPVDPSKLAGLFDVKPVPNPREPVPDFPDHENLTVLMQPGDIQSTLNAGEEFPPLDFNPAATTPGEVAMVDDTAATLFQSLVQPNSISPAGGFSADGVETEAQLGQVRADLSLAGPAVELSQSPEAFHRDGPLGGGSFSRLDDSRLRFDDEDDVDDAFGDPIS